MTIILKVCLHVWKLLLYVFLVWLLIKFQYDSGKKRALLGEKNWWNYVLSGFRAREICRPSVLRVIDYETDNEKHIAESQTGWRKKKSGERRGVGWTGMEPVQISKLFPPLFLLNTEKFTFFPHKSAWTVCFGKISFIDKVTGACTL